MLRRVPIETGFAPLAARPDGVMETTKTFSSRRIAALWIVDVDIPVTLTRTARPSRQQGTSEMIDGALITRITCQQTTGIFKVEAALTCHVSRQKRDKFWPDVNMLMIY